MNNRLGIFRTIKLKRMNFQNGKKYLESQGFVFKTTCKECSKIPSGCDFATNTYFMNDLTKERVIWVTYWDESAVNVKPVKTKKLQSHWKKLNY